ALFIALIAATGWVSWRMTSTPDLGAKPGGTLHGQSDPQLAAFALTQLIGLVNPLNGHATVTFSERDLTAIAVARASSALANPQVRVRGGALVVSGETSVLGVHVTAIGHLGTHLVFDADGLPDVGLSIDEIDAGLLTLPDVLRSAIADKINAQVNLGGVLDADARLRALRPSLECVAVVPAGVVLGFHGPLKTADPAACTRA
ncbi:MAG TPA: hypothetical protein VFO60_07690, partial [Candidatus Dormibacteraeota bacterium]|nr:hypothetical protein [Candidatus Dormibacteraeota bacterium]